MSDRALLIGINRYARVSGLRGCINDAESYERLLVDVYGYSPYDIRVLTDGDATKEKVLANWAWLAEDSGPGDRRVFQFSGHGSFTVDTSGDEADGYDELLCLQGYPNEYLTDDEIRDLVAEVHHDTNLTVIMDCCHSGTNTRRIPSLPADPLAPVLGPLVIAPTSPVDPCLIDPASPSCRLARFTSPPPEIEAHPAAPPPPGSLDRQPVQPRSRLIERAAGPAPDRAILLAGCRADQTSADAHLGGQFCGAFSYFLVDRLRRAGKTGIFPSVLIPDVKRALKQAGFDQVPQLEAARPRLRVLGPPPRVR